MPPSRDGHASAARAIALLRLFLGAVFIVAAVGKFTMYKAGGAIPLPMVSATWQVELPTRLGAWLASHPEGMVAAYLGAYARLPWTRRRLQEHTAVTREEPTCAS